MTPPRSGSTARALVELRAEREEAEARCDLAAQRAADAEIAWLERELRGAFGRRRAASSPRRRARRSTTGSAPRSRAIADVHPELGRHLRHSVRTGVVCVYQPESADSWQIGDATAR